ncbi:MAG: c-type cytochrome, partial [Candidatus Hydrogenedentes bacterium]|nr:c-type cytochrome [Candidatus Hydrogenedentota bacterium]
MPDLFAGSNDVEKGEAADALAHFLYSLGGAFQADTEAPPEEELERGARLFHSVGCVACHEPTEAPDASASDDPFADPGIVTVPAIALPSIPLPDLAWKTSATALAAFLLDPEHARPGGRMPDMTLTGSEATAIANWLQSRIAVPAVQSRIAVPAVPGRQPPVAI